jgi:hypothetical protein
MPVLNGRPNPVLPVRHLCQNRGTESPGCACKSCHVVRQMATSRCSLIARATAGRRQLARETLFAPGPFEACGKATTRPCFFSRSKTSGSPGTKSAARRFRPPPTHHPSGKGRPACQSLRPPACPAARLLPWPAQRLSRRRARWAGAVSGRGSPCGCSLSRRPACHCTAAGQRHWCRKRFRSS